MLRSSQRYSGRILAAAFGATLTLAASPTEADDFMWAQEGGFSDRWSSSDNWQSRTPKDEAGRDNRLFFEGNSNSSNADPIDSEWNGVQEIVLNGDAFTVGTLADDQQIVFDASADNRLVSNSPEGIMEADLTVRSSDGLTMVSSDGHRLEVRGDVELEGGGLTVAPEGTGQTVISGGISGDQAVEVSGSNEVSFSGVNTYTGETRINDNTLSISGGEAIGDQSVVSMTGDQSELNLSADETIGGLRSANDGDGDVGLDGNTLTLDNAENHTYSGAITGGGRFVKEGVGDFTYAGGDPEIQSTTVNAGRLILENGSGLGEELTIDDEGIDEAGTVDIGSGADLSLSKLTMRAGTLEGDRAVDADTLSMHIGTVNVELTGSATLEFNSLGELTLNAANTYTGGTTLKYGTVILGNDEAFGTGTVRFDSPAAIQSDNDARVIANDFVGGNGQPLQVEGPNDLTLTGVISGDGGLTKRGAGTLFLEGENTYTSNTSIDVGTLALRGEINSNVFIYDDGTLQLDGGRATSDVRMDGGILRGAGTITGLLTTAFSDAVDRVDLSHNGSFDTLNVGGDFTVGAGDTLYLDVGAEGESDRVAVGGEAELQSGSTVELVRSGEIDESQTYTLVSSSGLTNGSELVGVGLDGEVAVVNDATDLIVSLTMPGAGGDNRLPGVFELASGDSDNAEVGRALDSVGRSLDRGDSSEMEASRELLRSVGPTTGSNVSEFANTVNAGGRVAAASSEVSGEVNQAFSQTQSSYFAARRAGRSSFAAADGSAFEARPMLASSATDPQLLAAALAQNTEADDPAGADGFAGSGVSSERGPRYGAFAKTFGLHTDIDQTDDRTGYQANTFGVQTGLDWELSDQLLVGLSFGYARTDAELNNNLGDVESDSYRIGPYASYTFDDWFVDASLSYGYHRQDSSRATGLGNNAEGDYNAHDASAYASAGYDFTFDNGLVLTPSGSLRYTYYDREGYTESGQGSLQYAGRQTHTLTSRLGAQVSYAFEFDAFTLAPEAALGWEHEYLQDDESVEAQFAVGSERFDIDTSAPEQDSAFVSVGVSALLRDDISTFVKYEGNFGEDSEVHGVAAGLNYRF